MEQPEAHMESPDLQKASRRDFEFEGEGIPFGGYRLIRKIAVGGMAEVYLALSFGAFGFQRQEVIKALLPTLAKNADFVEMFIHEAVLSAEFRHPNLVQVYDLGKVGGLYFLAMEFVDGVDLMRLVRRCRQIHKPIPVDIVLNVICQAADGLAAVHEAKSVEGEPLNVVHRDVNPQNLMITFNGQAKLVDFGVAQTLLVQAEAEQALMGKGPYMAPEQWLGDEVDRRADIFALGTVLYELTVGRRLFRRTSAEKTKKAVLSGDIPRPGKMRRGFPRDLEAVILKSLALNPSDRYTDTRAMRRDLELVQNRMGGALHSDDVAFWMQHTFKGLSKDELWPKMDLTAPGQLTEAQEVLRRSLWNLPAFSEGESDEDQSDEFQTNDLEDDTAGGAGGDEQTTSGKTTEDHPEQRGTNGQPMAKPGFSMYAALIFLAGLVAGSLITALIIRFT